MLACLQLIIALRGLFHMMQDYRFAAYELT